MKPVVCPNCKREIAMADGVEFRVGGLRTKLVSGECFFCPGEKIRLDSRKPEEKVLTSPVGTGLNNTKD